MCKCSHPLTRHFFLIRIICRLLCCNGMRGNKPGSVCSLGGELVVGATQIIAAMQGALNAGGHASKKFRGSGAYICLEGLERACAAGLT